MPLKQIIQKLNKNHLKSVTTNLKWFDDNLNSKKSKEVIKVNGKNFFKPGKIYRFYYHPTSIAKTPYFDAHPLIIALGPQKFKSGKMDLGLNLNYFPFATKVHIINTIYKHYKSAIETQIRQHREDASNQQYFLLDYDVLIALLPNYNIPFGIRNYKRENRLKTSNISFENFYRLPFIADARFNKKNLTQIHSMYYKSLKT